MAVVDAVAVSVGHHAPALSRALGLVESQDGDLGEFGAAAAAGAAPAQDFLALVLERKKSQCGKIRTVLKRFSECHPMIPHANASDSKSGGKYTVTRQVDSLLYQNKSSLRYI